MTDGTQSAPTEAQIEAVLAHFDARPMGQSCVVATGWLNLNLRVETDRGTLFVRRMREGVTAERAADEHALIEWAHQRGIPTVMPMRSPDGRSVVTVDDELWAAFPWVEGVVPTRGTLSDEQVRALGEVHGRVDSAMAAHPASATVLPPLQWDAAKGLAELAAAREVALERGADEVVLSAMARQVELLEGELDRTPLDFSGLPGQLVHGDFHDQQVIFDANDEVIAVTDWELFRVAPRIRQVLRSLDFAWLLDDDRYDEYLAGYRRHVALSEWESRAGVRLWRLDRIYSTWIWSVHFIEANHRAGEFLHRTAAAIWRTSDDGWWERLEERFVGAAGAR